MENHPVSEKLNYWLGLASFNGFNRLAESKPKVRMSWFVVIVVAYLSMCYHISKNIRYYLSYPVTTKMQFSKYDVTLPDVTVCPVGIPKEYYKLDDEAILIDSYYRFVFGSADIDRQLYQPYYFNKLYFFEQENFTSGHIGSYIMDCNYLGKSCDFHNFTLIRDPVFTDCFTFQPNSRHIPRQGKVLTLGLYTNEDLMMYSSDFIVTLHEQGTLPDIVSSGFKIRSGGITHLTFKTKNIKHLSTPNAPCGANQKTTYLFTRTSGEFNYTAEDCFRRAVQQEMVDKLKCISPLMGMVPDLETAPRCLNLPPLSYETRRYVTLRGRLMWDMRYGTGTFTEESKLELQEVQEQALQEYSNVADRIKEHFHTFNSILQGMILKYQDIKRNCTLPCERVMIDTWSSFVGFSGEDVDQIIESKTPESIRSHQHLLKKYSKVLKNLENEILTAKMKYLSKISDIALNSSAIIHQKKHKEQKENVTKEFTKRVAFVEIRVVNVPGDGMVEEPAYLAFTLLSDLGGNVGLWVGVSVISIFELLELLVLLFGGVRKRRQNSKTSDGDETDVPLV